MYSSDIDDIKSIVRVLSSRIEHLLRSDSVFDQSDVTVSSRVKEPYSLWKKMLRYRKEIADAKNRASAQLVEGDVARQYDVGPATLSLKWVPDAIAFRVVLRALRLSPMEEEDELRRGGGGGDGTPRRRRWTCEEDDDPRRGGGGGPKEEDRGGGPRTGRAREEDEENKPLPKDNEED